MGFQVVTLVVVVALAVRWGGPGRHVGAGWGAGLVAAAGAAWLAPPYEAAEAWLMLVSDVTGSLVVVGVLVLAYRRAALPDVPPAGSAAPGVLDGPAARTAGP